MTINIYFPAEEVESVAGEIVEEIRGPKSEKTPEGKSSRQDGIYHRVVHALSGSVAWAKDPTKATNPTIRALKDRMKARYGQMKPFYKKGAIVEKDNGYAAVGDTKKLGIKQRNQAKKLVDAENKDRSKLYREVAKVLKIDASQVDRIAAIFAKQWKKSVR